MATLYFKYRSVKEQAYLTARFQFRLKDENGFKDIYYDAKSDIIISKSDWNKFTSNRNKSIRDVDLKKLIEEITYRQNALEKYTLNIFSKITNPEDLTKLWFKEIITE